MSEGRTILSTLSVSVVTRCHHSGAWAQLLSWPGEQGWEGNQGSKQGQGRSRGTWGHGRWQGRREG